MSGTISGGKKAAKKNIELHGKNFYKEIGRKGGKRSTTGGFASQKVGKDGLTGAERAKLVGAKGGRISRRKPRSLQDIAKHVTSANKLYTVLQNYIPTQTKAKKMTNKELTELMIKQLLHEWKRTKSTATAYDICDTLCEYYKINGKDKNEA